jgi:hypothetical protein
MKDITDSRKECLRRQRIRQAAAEQKLRVDSRSTTVSYKSVSRAALLVGIFLTCQGCGEGQDPPPPASPNVWCNAACRYESRCVSQQPTDCVTACLGANAGYFASVTSDFLRKMASCFDQSACATDWKTMTDACYKSTAPTLTPSAAVIDFCKAMSVTFFECYYADDDLTFCAGDFAAWSDSAIERAKACASSACASLSDCLSSAFKG